MPKFVGLLQDEISRLARKEVTKSQKSLKKTAVDVRKENSELKTRVKSLEKAVEVLQKAVGCEKQAKEMPSVEEVKGVKIQPRSIATLRKKHGLSVLKMAQLLDINNKSLDRWEKGIGKPQSESKKKLLAFKKLSKSEVRKMLAALKSKKVKVAEAAKAPKAPVKKTAPKKKIAKKKTAPAVIPVVPAQEEKK
ncbi:MAG: hypothetical protein A2020_13105 [Lentisphaerae bacterium GWF2_45_14]|nr:MAG: hypothetical protein A2020_13105 [Lentisphaerae bacterium GWF2_45_14]